jgi:hypothetical protein
MLESMAIFVPGSCASPPFYQAAHVDRQEIKTGRLHPSISPSTNTQLTLTLLTERTRGESHTRTRLTAKTQHGPGAWLQGA